MPSLWINLFAVVSVTWVLSRLIQFIIGDCDLKTLSARIQPHTFSSKVVWITGASSGIGAALALRLAQQGALLVLTARRKDKLVQLSQSLPCPSQHVHVLPLDLSSNFNVIHQVASTVPSIFGRLDYVFNNAGVSTRVSANDLDMQHVANVVHLDFLAHVALTKAVLPALRACSTGRGTIVNTASIAAVVRTPLRSTYSASKAALAAYFRCLELEEPAIRVINAFPGSVRTPIAINAVSAHGLPYGRSDLNIENGMHPERVAECMLAAVSADISNPWIARGRELMAIRAATWLPGIWEIIAARKAAGYRTQLEKS